MSEPYYGPTQPWPQQHVGPTWVEVEVKRIRAIARQVYRAEVLPRLVVLYRGVDSIRSGGRSGLVYLLYAAGFCYLLVATIRVGPGSRGFPYA